MDALSPFAPPPVEPLSADDQKLLRALERAGKLMRKLSGTDAELRWQNSNYADGLWVVSFTGPDGRPKHGSGPSIEDALRCVRELRPTEEYWNRVRSAIA